MQSSLYRAWAGVIVVGLLVTGCGGPAAVEYPPTRRVDQVDKYHGVEVADPYRWLETDVRQSPEVAQWVADENAVARAYLDAIPQRPAIVRRLTELWNYERYSLPSVQSGRYFYLKNNGLQNQSVLYVADSPTGEGRVLIDPNQWSADGTIAMSHYAASEDGRLLAYARSEAGSDWQEIHVLDVQTGEPLADRLQWVRFGDVQWDKAGSGFYYNRYPEPPEGEQYQMAAKDQMVCFHKLGTEQAADQLIYRRPDQPDWGFHVQPTDDGRYLVLSISRGTDPQNQVYVRDAAAAADAPWTELVGDFDNQFWLLGNDGPRFFFLSDQDAPTKRVVAMDIDQPGREKLTETVPASDETIESASILSGRLIVQSLKDVLPQVRVFDLAGHSVGDIELPGLGTAAGFGGDQDDTETFYAFTSYNRPATIYRYDVLSGESRVIHEPQVKFDPNDYRVEQVFYNSKDGTRVPMILAYRKDLPPDRPHPTLLTGYGGFSISESPFFRPDLLTWMEMGGALAVPNLRGGGEYGEAWHQAGKIMQKQNVFDDFIAAAEYLVAQRRTSSDKLAVMGGSNGGLLVGAVETQRPDLFGACIPVVGVMDMLRFHQFTAGQFWRDEYGSADDPEQFQALVAYSPYHSIKDGTRYPATLVMTADTDDRVVPMHSFKFAAAMQRAQAGTAPILLRVEFRAGHGSGTPLAKQIDIAADRWAFLAKVLDIALPHDWPE
jgi:prolyl oligopeptidase